LLAQPIGGDPAMYAYIGARILDGDLPYRDVFEQKPPGVLYTYAAAFAALGRTMAAVQALDFLAWVTTVAVLGATAWTLWRDRALALTASALGAVFIHPNLQSSFKQAAQAETFIMVWALAALLAVVRRPPALLMAGAACGVAFTYKYNAALYLVAALGVAWLRGARGLRAVAIASAGFAGPIMIVAVGFAWSGGLADLIDATIRYNAEYTMSAHPSMAAFLGQTALVTWRFATMNFLWTVGLPGILLILWRALRGDASGLPVAAFAAAAYLAILANARFYPQYFLQALPFLALAAALALVSAWRATWASRRRLAAAVLALAVGVELWRHAPFGRVIDEAAAAVRFRAGAIDRDVYYGRFATSGAGGDFSLLADVRLADRIRRTTRPEEPVYLYGGEALVLFLAGRRSPSRFIWNDPFTAGAFKQEYGSRDLIRELDAAPPAYFIVLRNDGNQIDPVDSLTHFRRDPVLQRYVAERYRELGWIEGFLVFERRDRGGGLAAAGR
jgi:hypothetical protein